MMVGAPYHQFSTRAFKRVYLKKKKKAISYNSLQGHLAQ